MEQLAHIGQERNRTLVMGILNVTPDSFSDGGLHPDVPAAVAHAIRMAEEGADWIDVGGESTRPTGEPVSADVELARVLPVIRALRRELPDLPLSIDTMKAEVARAAIEAGATLLNDVWGFQKDPQMARVVAETGVVCCLMHNRTTPVYENLVEEVCRDLMDSVRLALEAGVARDRIWLDPGIGFGKTWEQNLQVMEQLEKVCALGFPVLLGTSRKSFIGLTLGLPVGERLEGTLATTALGIAKGVGVVRVHDVAENVRTCRMADAIVRGWRPDGGK